MLPLLVFLAGLPCLGSLASPPIVPEGGDPPDGWLRVERGKDGLPLLVPRDEELSFRVVLDIGLLGHLEAGKVVLSSGAERYLAGLPVPGTKPAHKTGLETGWLKSVATGGYAGYDLHHVLLSRLIPHEWPRVFYTDTQGGSENRRRETKVGRLEGGQVAIYRHDGHCKGCDSREHFVQSRWLWGKPSHCDKCKLAAHRMWRDLERRAVPEHTVDMLGAVYLARALVREGKDETTFPLIDKQKLWSVFLKRGERRRIEVPAGRFDCVQVVLRTEVPAGEPPPKEGFEGMFGLRGSIRIWMEESTGVPVLIEGEFPVPVIGSLDVEIELKSHRGTPPQFVSR